MNGIEAIIFFIGLSSGALLIAAILWSIKFPSRRFWPPASQRSLTPIIAWALTLGVFGSAIALGILRWGTQPIPDELRWAGGLSFIAIGNVVVWWGAFRIGLKATSGAKDELVTTGLYRYSRNPQYLADIAIFLGIGLLSASSLTWPVVGVGIVALAIAPLAEEPWLRERYGRAFDDYCATTRRFL